MNLLTKKSADRICWQNLLTKNKSADERNLLTESADKNQICWQPKNRAGSMHQNLFLKLCFTPARPWLARTFLWSNLTPVHVLGPDLPGRSCKIRFFSHNLYIKNTRQRCMAGLSSYWACDRADPNVHPQWCTTTWNFPLSLMAVALFVTT